MARATTTAYAADSSDAEISGRTAQSPYGWEYWASLLPYLTWSRCEDAREDVGEIHDLAPLSFEQTEVEVHDDQEALPSVGKKKVKFQKIEEESKETQKPEKSPSPTSDKKVDQPCKMLVPASGDKIVGKVPKPPQEHLTVDGHVDLTGHWKCKDTGGEVDALLTDLWFDLGWKTLQAVHFGKHGLFRSFKQNGHHVQMIDQAKGLQDKIFEFDITGQPQKVSKAFQVSYWDAQKPHILCWQRARTRDSPRKWIRHCAFLLSKDQLRVETTSSTDTTAWWIFERQAA